DPVEQRAIEDAALAQAELAQALAQLIGRELARAGDTDIRDRGALDHRHDQYVALALEPDVAEEAGPVQRLDGLLRALLRQGLADAHGQIVEHRPGGDALQPLDPDVLDGEIFEGKREDGQDGDDERREHSCHYRWGRPSSINRIS